ncbi:MAG: hypothetical protein ACRDTH_18750 [Pseudonocardiaceae bacterium]
MTIDRTAEERAARDNAPTLRATPIRRIATLLRAGWSRDPALTVAGCLLIVVLVVTLVGIVTDRTVITGAPAWLKPAKFAVSNAIYGFTLLWLLSHITGHRRLVRTIGVVTASILVAEQAIIVVQAGRGTMSHFNVSTSLDAALYLAMGVMIALVLLAGVIVAVLLSLQQLPNPAFTWALRLGATLSVVGMSVAYFMVQPTADQLATAANGSRPTIIGAHSVGVADGGPGLPILGWSTVGGDLRVPHFFGLHGLQVLLVAGYLISRRLRGWPNRNQVALVWVVGLSYLGLVVLLTWQALRQQPVLAPDTITVIAATALFGITGFLASTIAADARRHRLADKRRSVAVT